MKKKIYEWFDNTGRLQSSTRWADIPAYARSRMETIRRNYINKLRKIRKEREAKALALRAQDKSNNKS